MSLIALATYGDHAEIVTDESQYDRMARRLGRSFKVHHLGALDAATVVQGAVEVGINWRAFAGDLASECPTFDEFASIAPDALRESWTQLTADRKLCDSAVFLVGYSEARGRFVAHGFASEDDWTPFEVRGLFVHPSPTTVRPSDLELGRLPLVHPADLEALRYRPKPEKPATREDWIDLAKAARKTRACAPVPTGLKTLVTGRVWHTRLSRGACTTEVVHEFDDSGEEFLEVVRGTYHPQAQLGACLCGSGRRAYDCHLAEHLTEPCMCESGKTFAECCSVLAGTEERATA